MNWFLVPVEKKWYSRKNIMYFLPYFNDFITFTQKENPTKGIKSIFLLVLARVDALCSELF